MLRLVVGGTMLAHGWNHAFGGGKLPGFSVHGWAGLAIAALAGTGGGGLLLATSWRPGPSTQVAGARLQADVGQSVKKVI